MKKFKTTRVLFPIGSFFPDQSGGPSNTLYWHCKALKRHNIIPVIVTTNKGVGNESQDKWLFTEFGEVVYTSNYTHFFPLRLIYFALKSAKNVELIHLTSVFYLPSLIIFLVNYFFFKKTVIWSPRGELDEKALIYSSLKKKVYLKFLRFFKRRLVWHSTSLQETNYIYNVFSEHVKVIELPNYIEVPERAIPSPSSSPFFLYIGRIHPKKGIDNLLQGLANSSLFIQSDFSLIIAGDDNNDYAQSLKGLTKTLGLSKKISFVGQVTGSAKEQLYADAYFTILPSHTENFGNVVIESLCQGTPVIASKGTPWEGLIASKSGFWEDNSPHNLSLVIDDLIQMDTTTYEAYRKNAYTYAIDNFDVSQNIGKWLTVLSDLETKI